MRPLRTRDRFAILGLALLCLPLLLEFGPFLEESRGESRAIQAYLVARQIQERVKAAAPEGTLLNELDPWGNRYQLRPAGDGRFLVLSSGSNGHSPPEGFDEDDVYTGMPVPPSQRIRRQKRLQWLSSLLKTATIFLLAVIAYLSLRRIPA
jgi:hypothetical protein